MRKVIFSLFLLAALVSPLMAQTPELEESQKAVLVFDIRLDRIRGSDLAKTLNLEDQINAWAAQQNDDGPDPTKIERVYGALSAPKDLESAQGLAMGQMPMEFFVKIKFVDEESANEMMEKIKKEDSPTIEKDGKTYYRPPDAGAPEGILLHQFDSTTVEVGTETYIFHPSQPAVFSAGLKEAWSKIPDEAVRLAADLEGASGIISEAVAMGKEGGDAMTSAYLDLIDNAKNVRLSLDLSGENLLTLQATGVNQSEAEELRGGLDAVLGIAKMGGAMQVNALKEQDPETAEIADKLLKSLQAKVEGDEVSVVIPKPDGFDAAVKGAVEKYGGMVPGGN
jgi:hypothetical protein